MDLLANREYLNTADLIAQLPSSPATIRRDLVALEREGLIHKARGRIFQHAPGGDASPGLRWMLQDREKRAIGRAAAGLVHEGDSIIVDSGTTNLVFAGFLRGFRRLSVITNSIPVAYLFNGTKVSTFLCGGMVDNLALVDADALGYFSRRRVNKAFLGATGVRGEDGLAVSSMFQYEVKRRMVESANEVYVLLGPDKFESMGIIKAIDFREITGLVTVRSEKNAAALDRLAKLGLRIVFAEEEPEREGEE